MRVLSHENLCELLDICYHQEIKGVFGNLYIVIPLMASDLYKVIREKEELSDDHIKYMTYQIAKGLHYMHSANVIHRDLKPSNILTTEECDIKLCDFGLSRTVDDPDDILTEYVVTRYYRAPEIMLSSNSYSTAVDL